MTFIGDSAGKLAINAIVYIIIIKKYIKKQANASFYSQNTRLGPVNIKIKLRRETSLHNGFLSRATINHHVDTKYPHNLTILKI